MADDLSLLFRLRGDSAGAKNAIAETRAAIASLRQTSAGEFNALQQISTTALTKITSSLTNFAGSVPVVGNAVSSLSSELIGVGTAAGVAGAELGAIAGPVGIAVVAVGAMTAAVIALGEELFSLAKFAAESEGKLFDLSQQTGVSVETLSALQELAKTTGGSIESVAASLGIFQKNLEAAQDPTTKQAEAFRQLGVNADNTEEALRQSLSALAKMPEGFKQTALALEIFGRSGKQMLAILKESHGNIDRTIDELQRMGLASTESAKQADEFNDALVHLDTQFNAIKVRIGNEVVPSLIEAFNKIEKIVKDNKDAIDAFATVAQKLGTLLGRDLVGALRLLEIFWKGHKLQAEIIVGLYERWAAAAQLLSGNLPNITANAIPKVDLPTGGGPESGQKILDQLDKLRELKDAAAQFGLKKFDLEEIFGLKKKDKAFEEFQARLKKIRELNLADALGALDQEEANTKRSLARRTIDFSLYYAKLFELENERHLLIASSIELDRQAAEKIKDSNKQAVAAAEIRNRSAAEERRNKEALARLDDDRLRHQAELTEKFQDFANAQAEQLRFIKEGAKSALDIANDFIVSYVKLGGTINDNQIFWLRFDAMLIQVAKDAENLKAQLKEVTLIPPPSLGQTVPEFNPKSVFDDSVLGLPPEPEKRFRGLQSALDDLGESLGKLFGASKDFKIQFGDVIGGAVFDLAQGVGSLVEQYVLLGETGPQALRKLLAATLAHLAAEAAVKAVFQLAEGFAALFFNPAEAAAHFTSAALFGSIAGVAAAAGRSVAGDLFKQPSSGASSTSAGNGQLNPLTLSRNAGVSPQPLTINIKVQQDRHSIVDVFADDYRSGGQTRQVVTNDGGI